MMMLQRPYPAPRQIEFLARERGPSLPRIGSSWGRISRRFGVMSVSRTKFPLNGSLPLFAADDVIGAWLLGPNRLQEWQQIAPLLEARGLPKVDHLMGGRYTPAIVAFFDHQYGLDRRPMARRILRNGKKSIGTGPDLGTRQADLATDTCRRQGGL